MQGLLCPTSGDSNFIIKTHKQYEHAHILSPYLLQSKDHEQSSPLDLKMKSQSYLLSLMLFQTPMIFFLLRDTKDFADNFREIWLVIGNIFSKMLLYDLRRLYQTICLLFYNSFMLFLVKSSGFMFYFKFHWRRKILLDRNDKIEVNDGRTFIFSISYF